MIYFVLYQFGIILWLFKYGTGGHDNMVWVMLTAILWPIMIWVKIYQVFTGK